MTVTYLHRTLEQELCALARGISLECLVCGEFVLHEEADVICPECGSSWPGLLRVSGTVLETKHSAA